MYILVLSYSRDGKTSELASHISRGIEMGGIEARARKAGGAGDAPEAQVADLAGCSGLALGSPSYFGSIASPLKQFLEKTTKLWFEGALESKPAMLFGSSASLHGGQESLLLSMMVPLLHHGMVIVGTPYSITELADTKSGGTPYGPSAIAKQDLSSEEQKIAVQSGTRLAKITKKIMV